MCDPVTMLAVTIGSQVVGGIQQAQVHKANARMAQIEADQQRDIGRIEEMNARTRMDALISRQAGQLAARGIQLDSASALDLAEAAGREKFMEAQAARFNRESRATSLENESSLSSSYAGGAILGGASRAGATFMNAAPTIWPGLMQRPVT